MGDQFTRFQHALPLRRLARKNEKIGDWNGPSAFGAFQPDHSFKRRERHVHIGRIGGDAMLARSQNGEHSIVPSNGGAARAGFALVARHGSIAEVHASGALKKISAGGRHVAQLRGRSGKERLRQHGIVADHGGVMRQRGIANQRADLQAAAGQLLNRTQRQLVDVDQTGAAFPRSASSDR